jgi:hypothetical protein
MTKETIDPYDTNYLYLGINIDKQNHHNIDKPKYINNTDPYECQNYYILENKKDKNNV